MPSPREDHARRAARDLLGELGLSSYPIDPERIAEMKSLPVEYRDGFPSGVYGAMWRSGNQFGIVVSSQCPTDGHRRFTVAHELGHYHVDGHVEQLFARGDSQAPSLGGHFRGRKDPIEVEADAFASELLMPKRFVHSAVRARPSGIAGVRALSDDFQVSVSCAAIRLAELTEEPLAVVLSYNGVVEWGARSPSLWAHGGWARRSWRQEWVPRGSGTHRITKDRVRLAEGEDDGSALLACEWFEGAPQTLIATEEATGLGSYGRVLTVLTFPSLPDPDESYVREQRERDDARCAEDEESAPRRRSDWRQALRGYTLDDSE